MEITIQMPMPHDTARKFAAMQAIESHTGRTIKANFVEPPAYDPSRIDVSGTVKGAGHRTWERLTVAVVIALKQ